MDRRVGELIILFEERPSLYNMKLKEMYNFNKIKRFALDNIACKSVLVTASVYVVGQLVSDKFFLL